MKDEEKIVGKYPLRKRAQGKAERLEQLRKQIVATIEQLEAEKNAIDDQIDALELAEQEAA